MTWQVIDLNYISCQIPAMSEKSNFMDICPKRVGAQLRILRKQAGLSQLDLALITGISQRHLSCIETGKAKPSTGTLHALLSALDAPLEQSNSIFLAAGYAPRYAASTLTAPSMEMVRGAINHLLQTQNPAPAFALGSNWEVLAANAGTKALRGLIGLPPELPEGANLLEMLLLPGGLGDHLNNRDEITSIAWQRAAREALTNSFLATLLEGLPMPASSPALAPNLPPLVLIRVESSQGELRFLSTFTTFGMPLDITVASLRINHLIPADPNTWKVMTTACEGMPHASRDK